MDAVQISLNGQVFSISEGCTLAELLDQLEVNPRRVAVEVNETLVPRTQHTEYRLRADDRLEVVTLVGGG